MDIYISTLFVSFFIYAFAGWVWESFVCPTLTGNHMKNSGFLNGPIVPIYGVGAITVSLILSPDQSFIEVFFFGALIATTIEYVTSLGMEILYHKRWWDYSDKIMNINGRVCLLGFIVFGFFSIAAVKFVQPFLMTEIMSNNHFTIELIAIIGAMIMCVDIFITVKHLTNLTQRIESLKNDIEDYAQKVVGEMEYKKSLQEILDMMKRDKYREAKGKSKLSQYVESRTFKAFPHLIDRKDREK